MRVWREEVFGPVLPIVAFSSEAEAIELANDTPYGLTAYVMTSETDKVARVSAQLRAGVIGVNATSPYSPETPFGGYKHSGLGRTNGTAGFDDVTQIKVVATPTSSATA
jgi:acyl-CoA reductase-like NAD-dependent aldehyde dehydrogenase